MLSLITETSLVLLLVSTYLVLVTQTPLMLAISLLPAAVASGLICASISSKWLMCALFLVFLGGMMVVFIYATALTGNTKLTLKSSVTPMWPLLAFALLLTLSMSPQLHKASALAVMYSSQAMGAPCALVTALLTALFIVVKIVESFKGALVKHFP